MQNFQNCLEYPLCQIESEFQEQLQSDPKFQKIKLFWIYESESYLFGAFRIRGRTDKSVSNFSAFCFILFETLKNLRFGFFVMIPSLFQRGHETA